MAKCVDKPLASSSEPRDATLLFPEEIREKPVELRLCDTIFKCDTALNKSCIFLAYYLYYIYIYIYI